MTFILQGQHKSLRNKNVSLLQTTLGRKLCQF